MRKPAPTVGESARSRQLAVGSITACLSLAAAAGEPLAAPASAGCCNVVELRQYTLFAGHRDGFVDLFDTTFADALDATGMTIIGQFRDLDRPDRFVWIRGFQSMEARAQQLAAFYDGSLWHRYRDQANSSIDDSDNVLLLRPASSELRFKNIPARRSAHGTAPAAEAGLFVATLFYTKPDLLGAFGDFFDGHLRARDEAAGARSLAEYATSPEANNFPRLPIRTGEYVYVWIARFDSPQAYAAYEARLRADKTWRESWLVAREHLTRDPEVLRLSPTPGSRLYE